MGITFFHMRQLHQKLIELLLALSQLTTPTEIHPKAIHNTVNNEQAIMTFSELLAQRIQQFQLMLTIQRTGIGNVFLRGTRIDAEALGDLGNALRPERAFRVDVGDFSVGTTH